MDKKEEKKDILDEVKKADKIVKTQLLLKSLARIKKMAREILENKERCMVMLEEIGVSAEDMKRVIDFVNGCQGVRLTDDDKKDLRKWTKDEVKGSRIEIEKAAEKSILKSIITYTNNQIGSVTPGDNCYTTGAVSLVDNTNGNKLEVSL